jgi:predicted small lipoprotein YifL
MRSAPRTVALALVVAAAAGCGRKGSDRAPAEEREADRPGPPSITAKPAEKPIEPEPAPAARPAPLGPCPAGTAITALSSSIDISDAGPFDWSRFTIAKARVKDGGKLIRVFLSSQSYPVERMDSLSTPVAAKGDAVLAISLYGGADPVTVGEYRPGKYKDPFTALAELQVAKGERGAFVGLGITEGAVRVLDLPEGRICGEFEVQSERSLARGTFVAELE